MQQRAYVGIAPKTSAIDQRVDLLRRHSRSSRRRLEVMGDGVGIGIVSILRTPIDLLTDEIRRHGTRDLARVGTPSLQQHLGGLSQVATRLGAIAA